MGLANTPQLIAMVRGAQNRGLDVTTECYPYTAGSTNLESAIFDPGWQERQGITFKDIQWSKTGERLTEGTFEKYRKEGGLVVIFSIPEAAVRTAIAALECRCEQLVYLDCAGLIASAANRSCSRVRIWSGV